MKRIALFLLFGLFCLAPLQQVDAKVYLVAVGISDYPGTINDLRHPTDDVRLVVNTYKSKSSGMIYLQLYDSKATVSNILMTIQKVFNQASSNDIVVLFISGHGYEGGFVAYDGFLAWSRIRKALAKSPSKHKMIFADTCFAGTFRSNRTAITTSHKSNSNVMLFLSSRSSETSAESGSLKQGVFSAFLCSGLRGKADSNHDKTITAHEIYNYVHNGVIRKTAGKQHPVMWGNISKNMPVIRLK